MMQMDVDSNAPTQNLLRLSRPPDFPALNYATSDLVAKEMSLFFRLSYLKHMGGFCQNYDPFWGTLNTRCRIRLGIQKGP